MNDAGTLLAQAKRVVIFTGAGVSAESGVPTFRDALTGLWARFDAETLATPGAFDADPDLVWGWYEWRRAAVERVAPNPGHVALATIEARVPQCTVITQNVDDLHERAGSKAPIHLHGSLFAPRCSLCAQPAPPPPGPPAKPADGPPAEPADGPPAEHPAGPADERRLAPPRCERCGGAVRPGVVWFGEALPDAALSAAVQAATDCDLLLTIGTSGLVYPAAEIPHIAARFGAAVIQINPRPTPLDPTAAVNLRGTAAEILPALVEQAWPTTEERHP